jgi:filamentous hemagglutinin family protein
MKVKFVYIITFVFLLISNVWAEVTFDGTMNAATKGTTLTGDFEIKAEHGQIRENNLFHSFQTFNIDSGKKAVFTGPDYIQNVISRVTGMEPSTINGHLISEMPLANFYLLNPAGVIFGESATVNIKGSFHVSTADYLVMQNNDKFDILSSEPLLSIAEPKSFGFLDEKIDKTFGKIEITGSILEVSNNQTMSIIGGDIEISNSQLYVSDGKINIISVQSSGEITLLASGIDRTDNMKPGNISISDLSYIDVSGFVSGEITIKGGDFLLNKSYINAMTDGGNAGMISIDVKQMEISDSSCIDSSAFGGNAGNVIITAQNVLLDNDSSISTRAEFFGHAGDISIHASEDIVCQNNSIIFSDTASEGNAGNIQLSAQNIYFLNASGLANQTRSKGNGGTISLQAKQSIKFMGTNNNGYSSDITTYTKGSGNAGDVILEGNDVLFKDGARIYASSEGEGHGGNIKILNENGAVVLSGVNPNGENVDGFNSCISSQSEQTGKAGDIYINSNRLDINGGAYISNTTSGDGDSGVIHIESNDVQIHGKSPVIAEENYLQSQKDFAASGISSSNKVFSGIYSRSETQDVSDKSGGKIHLTSHQINISEKGTITTTSTGKRDAGDIFIETSILKVRSNASIQSASDTPIDGGHAGTIFIAKKFNEDFIAQKKLDGDSDDFVLETSDDISLHHGIIQTDAVSSGGGIIHLYADNRISLINSRITTNVKDGSEKGGDIRIGYKFGKSELTFLNHSRISANAIDGDGGAIHIETEQYFKSADSIVEAKSERGNDGTVTIVSPKVDVFKGLVQLPSRFFDGTKWVKTPCKDRGAECASKFIIKGRDCAPGNFDRYLPALYCNPVFEK